MEVVYQWDRGFEVEMRVFQRRELDLDSVGEDGVGGFCDEGF